jgi:hypothetical protein
MAMRPNNALQATGPIQRNGESTVWRRLTTGTLGALEVLLLMETENCCEKEDHLK